MNRQLAIASLLVSVACGGDAEPTENNNDTEEKPYAVFSLDSIMNARAAQGVGFLQFLDSGAITAGLYHLPTGATDNQEPHGLDEIYYVVNGAGQLDVDGAARSVIEGDVHYVRAGVPHRFLNITETLDVIVVFSKTSPVAGGDDGLSFAMSQIVASRDANQNVWNPFLNLPTLIFGMYMLPSAVGGDNDLTHTWDELNIVVNGSSTFTVDGDDVTVGPGSLMFVERGTPHRFRNLNSDNDILIFWNQ